MQIIIINKINNINSHDKCMHGLYIGIGIGAIGLGVGGGP